MADYPQTYSEFIQRFVEYAADRDDIRAARVIGSRITSSASVWSDLDIQFFTSQPLYYRTNKDWLNAITQPWMIGYDDRGEHLNHWSARFKKWTLFTTVEHGLAVDFMVAPLLHMRWHELTSRLQRRATPLSPEVILLDKDHRLARWGAPADWDNPPTLKRPSEGEFVWTVNEFWGMADRSTRYLARGKAIEARRMCGESLRKHLIQMIQWYSAIYQDWRYHSGWRLKDIELWADPKIISALEGSFASYDLHHVKKAMLESMSLFSEIAPVVAEDLHYPYPQAGATRIYEWVKSQLEALE